MLPAAFAWKIVRHLRFAVRSRLVPTFLAGVRAFVSHLPDIWRTRAPVTLATLRRFSRLSKGQAR
jgi:hypothetical protein